MAADHIVALDAGTGGARCAVLRPGAGAVATARRDWSYETPPGGGLLDRTFDGETFLRIAQDVIRSAVAKAGIASSDVAVVAVASQRLGIVVVDKDDRVVMASPNVDARAFMEGIAIDGAHAERVYASTGKLPSLLLTPARLRWLRAHDPDAYARADAVLTVGDWLACALTGERRGERSLAGDCGLLDVTTGERDGALLGELEVPERLLPPLVSSSDVAGALSKTAAGAFGLAEGTPVVIAGGDTQCALAGMGIESPGEAGIAAGSSCPVQLVTATPRFDARRRTWTDRHVVPGRWVIESSPADAGRAWQWWCETLIGDASDGMARAAALAAEAPPGAGELAALLGPGPMNAGAMGMHLGGVLMMTPLIGARVGRAELLRAGLENVAYALRANLEQAEEVAGARASRVAVGGGLTQAPVFARILADVVARPIEVAQDVEVTARGAAVMAARAAGMDETSLPSELRTAEPDAANMEGYERRYQRWRKLGAALDRTMQELA